MISWIRNLIFKSEFNRNVAKLVTGTTSANLITLFTLPILARIYSVENFGQFQLLLSLITIFIAISSLKYEMTIPLPKEQDVSDNLFGVAFLSLLVISGLLLVIMNSIGGTILSFYKAGVLTPYRNWICIAVFSAGLFELMNYVLTREKAFGKIAKFRITQVLLIQSFAICFGIILSGFEGLLYSFILGNCITGLWMIFQANLSFSSIKLPLMLEAARKYKKFPLINTPMALVNTFSMQLPVFMLSAYFSPEIVGYYMMANRMISTPMNLISKSVGRVYYKEASDALHKSGLKLLHTFKYTITRVGKLGLVPAVIIILFSPVLIKWFLGDQWITTGIFMQIMMPWLFFQFVNLSVGTTFSIINRQEVGFILIIISVLLRYSAMEYWNQTAIIQLTGLSIVASFFYISYITTSYVIVRNQV